MLDQAEVVGTCLQATKNGVGFVARLTLSKPDHDIWHGYPEAWDRMDLHLQKKWLEQKLITRRDLRVFRTRKRVQAAFGGRDVGG